MNKNVSQNLYFVLWIWSDRIKKKERKRKKNKKKTKKKERKKDDENQLEDRWNGVWWDEPNVIAVIALKKNQECNQLLFILFCSFCFLLPYDWGQWDVLKRTVNVRIVVRKDEAKSRSKRKRGSWKKGEEGQKVVNNCWNVLSSSSYWRQVDEKDDDDWPPSIR